MLKSSIFLPGIFYLMFAPAVLSATDNIKTIKLTNDAIELSLTPAIGGRLLSAHLVDKPNFLLLGDAVNTQPDPAVTPSANNIPYLGHETWVGPQSQWWQHQSANEARRAAKAVWPPDPYLVLAKYKVVEQTPHKVVMQGPDSPVSGVALTKTYSLVDGNPHQIDLEATATNSRDTAVNWDLWFNTRVPYSTFVYVPVANMKDVRVEHFSDRTYDGLTHNVSNGLFALENTMPTNKQGRKGKVFIQPAKGWLAAFRADQVLIIQFPLQPASAIHPEQGQIELYQEFLNAQLDQGLLELEVHAPYKTLAAGASMSASERWTLLPYNGEATPAAHRAFLDKLPQLR